MFSVIVPIYGIESYLPQCVDSLLMQSYKDFELILVDDGSPDRCPEICDSYARKDQRIKVIHKPNGGLVSARQAGIEVATGEYVVNVDGDDWVSPQMLERMYLRIMENGADVVMMSHYLAYEDRTVAVKQTFPNGFYDKAAMEREIYPNMLLNEEMQHIDYFLWVKAFRRSLITPYQLAVDRRISFGEDVACLMPMLFAAQSIYISEDPLYYYRYRMTSMSRNFQPKLYEQLIYLAQSLEKLTESFPAFSSQVDRYICYLCFVLLVGAAEAGARGAVPLIQKYIEQMPLRRHIQRAAFGNVTPKTRISYFLLRHAKTTMAYHFLRLCWITKNLITR